MFDISSFNIVQFSCLIRLPSTIVQFSCLICRHSILYNSHVWYVFLQYCRDGVHARDGQTNVAGHCPLDHYSFRYNGPRRTGESVQVCIRFCFLFLFFKKIFLFLSVSVLILWHEDWVNRHGRKLRGQI